MSKHNNIKKLVMIAVLTAISLVLYILGPKFPLPIFPSFLEINFSMLPIFIALFMFGYKEALLVILLRFVIKLPFSSTAYVGEVADLILALVTITLSAVIMRFISAKGKGIFQFILISLSWIIGGLVSNSFSFPLYIEMFGGKEAIIGAMSMISNVNASNYVWKYMIICVIPFNLIISIFVLLVTFPVHNRLKSLYDGFKLEKRK